jgi:hypothetical protein
VKAQYQGRSPLPWDPVERVSESVLEVYSFAGTVAHRPWFVRLANTLENIERKGLKVSVVPGEVSSDG